MLWSQACGYIFHSSFLAFDFLIVETWIQPLSEAFEIYQDDASNTTVDMYPLVHPRSPTFHLVGGGTLKTPRQCEGDGHLAEKRSPEFHIYLLW